MKNSNISLETNLVSIKKRGAQPKQCLEYILFPVAHSRYRNLLIARFGAIGVGIFDEIRIQIGGNKEGGYFIHYNNDDFELLASNLKIEQSFLENWFNFCLEKSIFSKEMYNKYNIITSIETQDNWILAAKERKGFYEGIIDEYMLIDYSDALVQNQKKYPSNNLELKNKQNKITNNKELTISANTSTHNSVSKVKLNEDKLNEVKRRRNYLLFLFLKKNNAFTDSLLNKDINFKNLNFKNIENEKQKIPIEKEKKVAAKKEKHPSRDRMVQIYESQGAVYANNKDENTAINNLIKHLEKECLRNFNYDESPEKLHDDIVQYYQDIITQKHKLSSFLQSSLNSFGFTYNKITAIILELKNANRKELEGNETKVFSKKEALQAQNMELFQRILSKHQQNANY
ncbi:MAG: hypothetical protein RLZZ175_3260 [Bacteroidota bacterium]|jgi:Txe/YoeB family toxin of Txe-Axe toxin-antitoxin module